LVHQSEQAVETRKVILPEQRDLVMACLQKMQKMLDLLNYKIEVYAKAILPGKEMVQTEE
jgi:hypothetical protein